MYSSKVDKIAYLSTFRIIVYIPSHKCAAPRRGSYKCLKEIYILGFKWTRLSFMLTAISQATMLHVIVAHSRNDSGGEGRLVAAVPSWKARDGT